MTRKLEEILNLPDSREIVKEDEKKQKSNKITPHVNFRNISEFDKRSEEHTSELQSH